MICVTWIVTETVNYSVNTVDTRSGYRCFLVILDWITLHSFAQLHTVAETTVPMKTNRVNKNRLLWKKSTCPVCVWIMHRCPDATAHQTDIRSIQARAVPFLNGSVFMIHSFWIIVNKMMMNELYNKMDCDAVMNDLPTESAPIICLQWQSRSSLIEC